jgi:hypothetical protein
MCIVEVENKNERRDEMTEMVGKPSSDERF